MDLHRRPLGRSRYTSLCFLLKSMTFFGVLTSDTLRAYISDLVRSLGRTRYTHEHITWKWKEPLHPSNSDSSLPNADEHREVEEEPFSRGKSSSQKTCHSLPCDLQCTGEDLANRSRPQMYGVYQSPVCRKMWSRRPKLPKRGSPTSVSVKLVGVGARLASEDVVVARKMHQVSLPQGPMVGTRHTEGHR